MNKNKLLFLLPALLAIGAITSCNKDKLTGVAKVVNDAKDFTVEQLVEKAREETGDFTVYSTSSKTNANVLAFAEAYSLTGTFSAVKKSESDFYTTVDQLIDSGSADVDAVVTQNGASVSVELDDGSFINYLPKGLTQANHYAFMYYIKKFAIAKTSLEPFTNVWDLIDTTVNVSFKKSGEPINSLFMAELTTAKWAAALKTAYDAKYGTGKADQDIAAGSYKNAGYMFMDKFLKRVTNVSSEGDLAKDVANATVPYVGFSPVSKYSLGATGNYNKVKFLDQMNGFAGYAYKFYYEISKTTDRPYTAMLYANYLKDAQGIASWTSEGNGIVSCTAEDVATQLENCVIENFEDVKADWSSLVAKLESYAS